MPTTVPAEPAPEPGFELGAGQRVFRDAVRAVVAAGVAPGAAAANAQQVFPEAAVAALAGAGLLAVQVSPDWGGRGLGATELAIAVEEISRVCASTGVIASVHNSLVCAPLERHGTPSQRARWLRPLATGAILGAFALTEPEAGSDAAGITTRAVRDGAGGGWVLDGEKRYITNAGEAALFVVFAVTAPEAPRRRVTALLVERETPGLTVGPRRSKLGVQAASTCDLTFSACRVPDGNVLGEPGDGLAVAFGALERGRVGIAAQALGIAQACLDASLARVRARRQFGRPLADFQAVQFAVADMAVEVEAARLLTYRAAARQDAGLPAAADASMAKLYASEAANRAATKAVQLHGALGYMREGEVERYFRDAKVTEIYEGTSEIQRLLIARHLLQPAAPSGGAETGSPGPSSPERENA
jgi:alkylation response protein AidB-like acyl-CoA dehydrogenase